MTWVIDMTHYLNESGAIATMPAPAAKLAKYFGEIVSAVSNASPIEVGAVVEVGIACRRRPGRRRCNGKIEALIDEEECIRWGCPVCQDTGYISHWQGTPWDRTLVS
jgi:hypothetical protein